MLVLFASCGERYEEVKDASFEGTWTLLESYAYVDTVPVLPRGGGQFLTVKKIGGENLLLFYSGGNYDSSFFVKIQDNNLYVRRVEDSVDVVVYKYVLDSLDNKIIKSDTVKQLQKPQNPKTNDSIGRYYGTYSLDTEPKLQMTLTRYQVDESGVPTTKLYRKDIYSRPEE
jgi:hypothetical protein